MKEFEGLFATDFGFQAQGKSDSMAARKGTVDITPNSTLDFDFGPIGSNSFNASFVIDHDSLFGSTGDKKIPLSDEFDDLFGGSLRYKSNTESRGGDASINLDSMFHGSSESVGKPMSSPVYDKPVCDDDIFDGVPGLKNVSNAKHEDVFLSSVSTERSVLDDLFGGFGASEREWKDSREKASGNMKNNETDFDDLIPGFGGISPASERQNLEPTWQSEPTFKVTKTTSNMMENPFAVLEPTSPPVASSSGLFTDPLEEINKRNNSGDVEVDGSSVSRGVSDDFNPFDGFGSSVPAYSSERSNRGEDTNPFIKEISMKENQTSASKEPIEKTAVESPENLSQSTSVDDDHKSRQNLFDTTKVSTDSQKSVGQNISSSYLNFHSNEADIRVDMSPRSVENIESSDDAWLTVLDIPLFTQPTTAPPPSRPPPPRPARVRKAGSSSSASTDSRKKVNEFAVFPNIPKYSQGPKSVLGAARNSAVSSADELDDFAIGRSWNNVDEHANGLCGEEADMNSAADAMKEAMDRAEAKFRHAKEARERENTKASRSQEGMQLEKEESSMQDAEDKALRENQEQLDHEWLEREREEEKREQKRLEQETERAREIEREKEEKEREERKLEKERERAREIEREKARQAVERATREARERASVEARQRAERAAVEKANAEARERAGRAAVQKAQAEARERAAAEARERAEKAAAEARERANTEAREKEAQERAAALKAEAEARRRAERAFVERATAEARTRAAAEARERAAATTRVNDQKNDNESFFSTGARASSAPRPRDNASFQDRQGPEVDKSSSSTSSNMRKTSSTINIIDDLSPIFGDTPSSGGLQEVKGDIEKRQRSRLENQQRTQDRVAKALAEKNQRDLQIKHEQEERHRISGALDIEIKRWAAGKEGNLRALLSTLQYVLWPECGWQPVSLTDLIIAASVKKAYRKATLCIHPDKVQQKGANLQQKYIAEKVFDLLKEAWNKFNSEELF